MDSAVTGKFLLGMPWILSTCWGTDLVGMPNDASSLLSVVWEAWGLILLMKKLCNKIIAMCIKKKEKEYMVHRMAE